MRKKISVLLLFIFIIGCKKESKNEIDVSHITTNVKVARFDIDFYTSTRETLKETKKKYPLLFPHNNDSVWINKINNKDERELFTETQKIFNDFSSEEKQLKKLFQHIKYYNPNFKEPSIITILTNIDYENRIVYAHNFLLISLDAYLGKNHQFYNDFPKYIRQNNTKNRLIVDVANAFIDKQIYPNNKRTFLDKMIYEGKKMYLLDRYLPNVSDNIKIGYSNEKFDWAKNSEENIWRYFIDKDILYSTDSKLNQRFLDIAPFSKFYLGEDTLSPGRVGVYIGWQIVRAFMQHNNISLQKLINTSEEEIFKESKYKPKK